MSSSRPKRETAADMTALVKRLKQCAQSVKRHVTHTPSTTTTTTINESTNTCAHNDTTTTTTTTQSNSVDTCAHNNNNASEHVFRAGMKVEAKDAVGDWYASKVVEVSEDGKRCLVHFTRWSSRFDEWVPVSSVRMRSLDTTTTTTSLVDSDGSQAHTRANTTTSPRTTTAEPKPEYTIGEQVLARWSDGKRYSATIRHVFNEQNAALVVFDDNYRKKVKLSAIARITDTNLDQSLPLNVNEVTPISNQRNDGFIKCGACGKTFRKASLMLWHERHCNQTVINESNNESKRKQNTINVNQCEQPVTSQSVKRVSTTTTSTTARRTRRTKSGRRRRRRFTPATTHSQSNNNNEDENKLIKINENIESIPTTVTHAVSTTDDNDNDVTTQQTEQTHVSSVRRAVKRRRSSQRPDVTALSINSTIDGSVIPCQPNTRLPFWDARGVAEQHESDDVPEVVHCCHCDEFEESGLMVQCDLCLSWQHAACVHYNSNCEHEYICGACRRPRLMRLSKRLDFSVSWLLKPNSRFRHNVFEFDGNLNETTTTSHVTTADTSADGVSLAHAFERIHDINEVIVSLSARVAKLERNASEQNDANDTQMLEIARTQQKLKTVLNVLEEKINQLEQNDAHASQSDTCSRDDASIKMQTQLLFEDLKNARKLCEN